MKTVKEIRIGIVLLITLLFTNCNSSVKNETENNLNEIPFEIAKNYFVKSTFKLTGEYANKISSKKEFDAIFGAATVMGENGKPTKIDFSKQFAIAIISEETDKKVEYMANKLNSNAGKLTLNYSKNVFEKQTFTSVPFMLIIVDKKFENKVVFELN